MTSTTDTQLSAYLLMRIRGVLDDLGASPNGPLTASMRFADLLDSMGMVEFLGDVAADCGCQPATLERCAGRRFGTIEQFARAMQAAGLFPCEPAHAALEDEATPGQTAAAVHDRPRPRGEPTERKQPTAETARALWLAGSTVRLPRHVQPGPELDQAVGRPVGWLERRAGILERHVWADEDPLDATAKCAAQALLEAGVPTQAVGALIAVSEAPPLAVGLAASIHHRLGLNVSTPCFEVGCACVGFLSAMALARSLVAQHGPVLVVSVEAHSRVLPLVPGPRGEAAALFGDGCAAAVFASEPAGEAPARLIDLELFANGDAADLIRVRPSDDDTGFCLEMDGVPLTEFALHSLASATRTLTARHGLSLADLAAVVAHGGNGRMPAMLARLLHLPSARVWSDVAKTGNLGSASVPAAWASRATKPRGFVIWTAVGAGLLWGAALWQVDARA